MQCLHMFATTDQVAKAATHGNSKNSRCTSVQCGVAISSQAWTWYSSEAVFVGRLMCGSIDGGHWSRALVLGIIFNHETSGSHASLGNLDGTNTTVTTTGTWSLDNTNNSVTTNNTANTKSLTAPPTPPFPSALIVMTGFRRLRKSARERRAPPAWRESAKR
jgi:hypothetical protein